MPRGKKFNAAEKHFNEKEMRLRRDLRIAEEKARDYRKWNEQLTEANRFLKEENERLQAANDVLRSVASLSDSDLKTLLDKARNEEKLTGMISLLGGMSHF